ncbi:MAG: hypothetical protein ABJB11_13870 [Ferruginibacter sp.]
MTDITININTGSEHSDPKITTTTDNPDTVVPKIKTPEAESLKDESPKNDDAKKMDITEDEHAKMGSEK